MCAVQGWVSKLIVPISSGIERISTYCYSSMGEKKETQPIIEWRRVHPEAVVLSGRIRDVNHASFTCSSLLPVYIT